MENAFRTVEPCFGRLQMVTHGLSFHLISFHVSDLRICWRRRRVRFQKSYGNRIYVLFLCRIWGSLWKCTAMSYDDCHFRIKVKSFCSHAEVFEGNFLFRKIKNMMQRVQSCVVFYLVIILKCTIIYDIKNFFKMYTFLGKYSLFYSG